MPRTPPEPSPSLAADPAGRILDLPGSGPAAPAARSPRWTASLHPPARRVGALPPPRARAAGRRRARRRVAAIAGATAVAAFLAPAHTQLLTPAYRTPRRPAPAPVRLHRRRLAPRALLRPGACASTPTGARTSASSTGGGSRGGPARCSGATAATASGSTCSGARSARGAPRRATSSSAAGRRRCRPPRPATRAASAASPSSPPDSCCPATQDRIAFTPTVAEIVEVAVPHLEKRAAGRRELRPGVRGGAAPRRAAPRGGGAGDPAAHRARDAQPEQQRQPPRRAGPHPRRRARQRAGEPQQRPPRALPRLRAAPRVRLRGRRREHAARAAAREVPLAQLLRLPRRHRRRRGVGRLPRRCCARCAPT